MISFGMALRTLRGQRKRTHIADHALSGDQKTNTQARRREFANYMARIETDKVPNVGMHYLRALAKGFGYATLGEFFSALDAVAQGRQPPALVEVSDAGLDVSALAAINLTLTGGFGDVCDRLTQLVGTVEQLRSAHAPATAAPVAPAKPARPSGRAGTPRLPTGPPATGRAHPQPARAASSRR